MPTSYHSLEYGDAWSRDERRQMRDRIMEGAGGPLAFQNVAVRRFGADAGIFVRQLLFHDAKGASPDGFVYKSIPEMQRETGLARRPQERARRILKAAGVLEEGVRPAIDHRLTLHYRLDLMALVEKLGDDLPNFRSGPGQGPCLHPAGSLSHPDEDPAVWGLGNTVNDSIKDPENNPEKATTNNNVGEENQNRAFDKSNVVPLNDATSRCLLILSKVKSFPRDQAENAVYLAELREEFPNVDPVEVCRQYEVWHLDNPGETRDHHRHLTGFFKRASTQASAVGHQAASRRPTSLARETGTPKAGVDALRAYEHPRGGPNDLRAFAGLAEGFDFSGDESPTGRFWFGLGGNDGERDTNLKRVRSVVRRAIREANEAEPEVG